MLRCAPLRSALSSIVVITFFAVTSAVMAVSAGAQGRSGSLPDSVIAKIDAVYARYARADAPGCTVGVFQNGRIAFENGYGAANVEYGVPITPTSPFIM